MTPGVVFESIYRNQKTSWPSLDGELQRQLNGISARDRQAVHNVIGQFQKLTG